MQRYFINEAIKEGSVRIAGNDAKHIIRVMRMAVGDKIICCGPDGRCGICKIEEFSADTVRVKAETFLNDSVELPVTVTISQGLPKGDKLDLVVQKGTELGAAGFLPFEAERSIVKWDRKKKEKKTERLRTIAKEAAEQSHRSRIPIVNEAVTFGELVSLGSQYNHKMIAYEEEAKAGEDRNLRKVMKQISKGQSLLVVIGPEGGFSESEISELVKAGFLACGLGPRILRTETAALYVLAAISYQFELLG